MCSAGAPWPSSTTRPASRNISRRRWPPSFRPTSAIAIRASDHADQRLLGKNALLFDSYLRDAIEVDVDAIADGEDVFICGIMEHIEEAGVHSGDSACSLPPYSLSQRDHRGVERADACKLALALKVVGLMNVQFAIKDGEIYRSGGQSARQPDRALRRQDGRRCRWPASPPRSWLGRSCVNSG